MDCSVDKKLAAWSHPKSCGQWLNVQMETSDEWCPSEVILGSVLFNIFVDDIDSGIKCTLCSFADDTKPTGAVDTLGGRDTFQRNIDKLERWAHVKLMKFHVLLRTMKMSASKIISIYNVLLYTYTFPFKEK